MEQIRQNIRKCIDDLRSTMKSHNWILSEDTDMDIESFNLQIADIENRYANITDTQEYWSAFQNNGCVYLGGEKEFTGILEKYSRLHPAEFGLNYSYEREPWSILSIEHRISFFDEPEYESKCPYDFSEFDVITEKILKFMSQRLTLDPNSVEEEVGEEDPNYYSLVERKPISTKKIKKDVAYEFMTYLKDTINLVLNVVNDSEFYDGQWHWRADSLFIGQYLFDKMAELAYLLMEGKPTNNCVFRLEEAFGYFEPDVPEYLLRIFNSKIEALDYVMTETIHFIEDKDYETLPVEKWFFPYLYCIGTAAFRVVADYRR